MFLFSTKNIFSYKKYVFLTCNVLEIESINTKIPEVKPSILKYAKCQDSIKKCAINSNPIKIVIFILITVTIMVSNAVI